MMTFKHMSPLALIIWTANVFFVFVPDEHCSFCTLIYRSQPWYAFFHAISGSGTLRMDCGKVRSDSGCKLGAYQHESLAWTLSGNHVWERMPCEGVACMLSDQIDSSYFSDHVAESISDLRKDLSDRCILFNWNMVNVEILWFLILAFSQASIVLG